LTIEQYNALPETVRKQVGSDGTFTNGWFVRPDNKTGPKRTLGLIARYMNAGLTRLPKDGTDTMRWQQQTVLWRAEFETLAALPAADKEEHLRKCVPAAVMWATLFDPNNKEEWENIDDAECAVRMITSLVWSACLLHTQNKLEEALLRLERDLREERARLSTRARSDPQRDDAEAGSGGPQDASKRKPDSPHRAQAIIRQGGSPSQNKEPATADNSRPRVSAVGAGSFQSDVLDDLQFVDDDDGTSDTDVGRRASVVGDDGTSDTDVGRRASLVGDDGTSVTDAILLAEAHDELRSLSYERVERYVESIESGYPNFLPGCTGSGSEVYGTTLKAGRNFVRKLCADGNRVAIDLGCGVNTFLADLAIGNPNLRVAGCDNNTRLEGTGRKVLEYFKIPADNFAWGKHAGDMLTWSPPLADDDPPPVVPAPFNISMTT
jgi:hypothetical protein